MDNKIDKEIGKRLLAKLNASGRSQAELAAFLGVTQASVSNWVNGNKLPRMGKIDKICEFLGCSRTELLIGEPEATLEDRAFLYYYSLLNEENKKRVFDIVNAFLIAQK